MQICMHPFLFSGFGSYDVQGKIFIKPIYLTFGIVQRNKKKHII